MATDLTKIATCCYCGSRTVLRLDKTLHELSCRNCGAALHNMKFVKAPSPTKKPKKKEPLAFAPNTGSQRPKRKKSKKKRRFDFKDFVEDGFGDFLEDVFDIFD